MCIYQLKGSYRRPNMATTVRSSSKNSSTTGTAISVAAPTGTAAGDVSIIVIHSNQIISVTDNNGSTPWTEDLEFKPNTVSGQTISVFSRRIQAGDPSTYNFTQTLTGRWSIIAVSFQNPNVSAIYDIAPTAGNSVNTDTPGANSVACASITTLTNNAIHCVVGAVDDATATITGSPSGYTIEQTTADQPEQFADKVITVAGATGTQTFTFSSTTGVYGLSFAIMDIGTQARNLLTLGAGT